MSITPLSLEHFNQLAQEKKNIPLAVEILADTETPLSSYIKFANEPNTFLLESKQGNEKWGRYSVIGLCCQKQIRVYGYNVHYINGTEKTITEVKDPLAYIENYRQQQSIAELPELPDFSGGLVGLLGYDIVRYYESKLEVCPHDNPLNTPDIALLHCEELIIFDNVSGTLILIVYVDSKIPNAYEVGQKRLLELQQQIDQPIPPQKSMSLYVPNKDLLGGFVSNTSYEQYCANVQKIVEYIHAGDVMQVVYSQRFSKKFTQDGLDLYRGLRYLNPSPYMYYLNFGDFQLVGSSPEILSRLREREVTVRPIAGTRKRGKEEKEDIAIANELLVDPKEIAEHLMLIDLGRNDVSKVCEPNSVRVNEKMVVEYFSHVMHVTSNIVGKLQTHLKAMDVLKATHPAGTLSGAPKIKAMQIIDELEVVKRNYYGGAIGYLSWNQDMDMAIAIRTGIIKDGYLHIQSGGGVVADSSPDLEWHESVNKAQALIRAAAMAEF